MNTGSTFLDRLVERLDRLDPTSVQNVLLKLVREKGFLETVFNTIREGVIVIAQDIRIHYINMAARELLGLPETAEGQRLDRFLRDVDWGALMAADPDEWHRVSLQEIEVFYPHHRILTFYVVPHSLDDDRNEAQLATIIFHDATTARRNTEETIASERVEAITQLAAGVAHEIGNPLNSLAIHLQLLTRLLGQSPANETTTEAHELLEVAQAEVQRLDAIVNNFLRAVHPARPAFKKLRLETVIAEALRFMREEIEDRNIRVEAALGENLPMIQGDAQQLKQAFYNIIKNAIQAMDDEGLLSIVCSHRDDFLELRFSDTGRGIRTEDVSRILEPYYTTRADGSGLGLLIVERILRDHGAELGIDSAEGKGTTFTLRFPLRARHVRLLEAPRPTAPADQEELT